MVYYNEIDPFAAQWLRNLIAAGHIAPGDVDERSITDVQADDLRGYTQCHFFAGIGVWSYALKRAGWPDDRPVWTGSCPCQPFSVAGSGKGTADERHLWPEWFRLISECRPPVILGEQVASPAALAWYDAVCDDLEGEGYAVGAADLCAAGVGAPHIRQRLYWVANHSGLRWEAWGAEGLTEGHGRRGANGIGLRSTTGWLANAPPGGQRVDGSASGDTGHAPQREPACRMEHPGEPRSGRDAGAVLGAQAAGGGERRRARGVADEPIVTGEDGDRLGNADGAGWEREGPAQPTRWECDLVGAWPGPLAGFWSNADWFPCSDGKARPVEPGTFPLAHGAPARVGRLRAYGNALCAPQAQAFVEAVMDCLGRPSCPFLQSLSQSSYIRIDHAVDFPSTFLLTYSQRCLKTVAERKKGALVQVIGLGHTMEAIIREACASLGIEPWGGPSIDGWSKHSDFLRCPYRYYLKHVLRMGPAVVDAGGSGALDIGSCVHLLLAAHYARLLPDERYPGYRANCPEPEALLQALIAAHLPLAVASEVERLYSGYVEHYAGETWEPMAVEMPIGVVGAHTARYDLVVYVEDGLHDGLWVGEHKTASPATDLEEFRYDGEVLGELFAALLQNPIDIFGVPLNGVCINALVKAKGLPRYQRLWLTFPQSVINEFGSNRGYWGQRILECEQRNVWPKNLYGCRARYHRCRFWEHCRTQDATRLVKLDLKKPEEG